MAEDGIDDGGDALVAAVGDVGKSRSDRIPGHIAGVSGDEAAAAAMAVVDILLDSSGRDSRRSSGTELL